MVDYEKPRPKRKWQNLLYLKCPTCDTKMDDKDKFFICPERNLEDISKNCFFIKSEKIAEFLLDSNHPAHFCLSEHEKLRIEEVVENLGFEYES